MACCLERPRLRLSGLPAAMLAAAASAPLLMTEPAAAFTPSPIAQVLAGAAGSNSLVQHVEVTCRIERHGRTTITYYCRSGFICDNPNNKCLPGPAIRQKLNKMREEAERAARKAAASRAAYRAGEDVKTLGKPGSTYYRWNGDPRIIPTPRHRQGGGIPAASRPAPRTVTAPRAAVRRLQLARVPSNVRTQILALVAAATAFQPNDPNRAGIAATLRKLVHDHKIPIDIDELMGDCNTPPTTNVSEHKFHQLRWRVPDIPFEVDKRGLCKDAKGQDEREACHRYQFGQVVMAVEPDIRALCRLQENDFQEKDLAALGECASRKFINAWTLREGRMPMAQNGTLINLPPQCESVALAGKKESLRDILRRLLNQVGAGDDEEGGGIDVAPPPEPEPTPQPAAAEAAPVEEIDEAFCAFIARRSVRGELTPGGGTAIPDYCRKALDAAKTCEQQQCAMADVIAEQERRAAAGRAMDWGSEDRAAINRLLGEVQ